MKRIFALIFLTILLTVLIFIIRTNFYYEKTTYYKNIIEEEFIEHTSESKISGELKTHLEELKKREELKSASKFSFHFFPKSFSKDINKYNKLAYNILEKSYFINKINNLRVEFHEIKVDVRGKMKNGSIKIFGVEEMELDEFLSVFIHELSHYIDLYYLERKVFTDPSYYFYNISWDSTKIIKKGQKGTDFVSGYAMSNKYEDFAESLTYYILHNNDFLKKTKKSYSLEKKYNFFRKFLFKNNEFIKTDFSVNNKIKGYYWDITKIKVNDQKFLQYLKKGI